MALNNNPVLIERPDGTWATVCPECKQEVESIVVPYVESQPTDSRYVRKTPLHIAACQSCLERLGLRAVIGA